MAKRKGWLILTVVAVVLAVSSGAYYFFYPGDEVCKVSFPHNVNIVVTGGSIGTGTRIYLGISDFEKLAGNVGKVYVLKNGRENNVVVLNEGVAYVLDHCSVEGYAVVKNNTVTVVKKDYTFSRFAMVLFSVVALASALFIEDENCKRGENKREDSKS